jgi:hypothetical protein
VATGLDLKDLGGKARRWSCVVSQFAMEHLGFLSPSKALN